MAIDTFVRNLVSNHLVNIDGRVNIEDLADHDVKEFISRLMAKYSDTPLTIYDSVNMDLFNNAMHRLLMSPSIDNKIILADQLLDDAFTYYKDEMQQMLDDEVSRHYEIDTSEFKKVVDNVNGEVSWIKK